MSSFDIVLCANGTPAAAAASARRRSALGQNTPLRPVGATATGIAMGRSNNTVETSRRVTSTSERCIKRHSSKAARLPASVASSSLPPSR
jgi:hypothetical protein